MQERRTASRIAQISLKIHSEKLAAFAKRVQSKLSIRVSNAGLVSADAEQVRDTSRATLWADLQLNCSCNLMRVKYMTDDRVSATDGKSKLGVAALNHACW